MMTPPSGMDADEFCLWLKKQIAFEGDKVFGGHKGFLILYSGPVKAFKDALAKLLGRPVKSNLLRGREQAALFGTNILDDMPIGQWLVSLELDTYFKKFYGLDRKKRQKAEFQVWATVSEELVRTAFGKAATAVCGADPRRVFCKHELPQVIRETKLDTINNLPVQIVKDFAKMGIVEAFRQVCKFELLALHYQARQSTNPTKANELREEWAERWSFYKQHLAKARKGRSPPKPERIALLRNRRRTIRVRYDFKAIKTAIIEDAKPRPPVVMVPLSLVIHAHI